MAVIRRNFLTGNTSVLLSAGGTTLTSADLAALPVVAAPDYAWLSLDPLEEHGLPEIVKVTAHSSGSVSATIVRGQQQAEGGGPPREHQSGTFWAHPTTALDLSDIEDAVEAAAASSAYYNLADYLVLDGVADDVPALNALINAAGNDATFRGAGVLVCPPGGIIGVGDTILVKRKNVTLRGSGWMAVANGGRGSVFKALPGVAGKPMLRLWQAMGCTVEGFRFQGAAAAKPSAAVSIYQTALDANPTYRNVLRNLWIGSLLGYDDDLVQFTAAIDFDGTVNGNGDENLFDDITIYKAITGVDVPNSQNVANAFRKLSVYGCDVGFKQGSSFIRGEDWTFLNNVVDLQFISDAKLSIDGFTSEGASRMFQAQSNLARLTIRGGVWNIGAALAGDGVMFEAGGNNPSDIILDDFKFADNGGHGAIVPKIQIKSAGNSRKYFFFRGESLDPAWLDMDTFAGGEDQRIIHIERPGRVGALDGLIVHNILGPGVETPDLTRFDVNNLRVRGLLGVGGTRFHRVQYTGGTFNAGGSTAWSNFQNGADLTLTGVVAGQRVEVGLAAFFGNEPVDLMIDVGSLVSAAIVNTWGKNGAESASFEGVHAWRGNSSSGFAAKGGTIVRAVAAGDLVAGVLTLRFRCRAGSAATRTIFGTVDDPLQVWAINHG